MKYSIVFDIDRCTGCFACAIACMDHNTSDPREQRPYWRSIVTLEETGAGGPRITYASLACLHCRDAACVPACPTGAIALDPRGAAAVTPSQCIGCRACLLACPFGAPRFGSEGRMEKCTLCIDRVVEGLDPACVRACPTKALALEQDGNAAGEKETTSSRPRRLIRTYEVLTVKKSLIR